MSMRLPGTLLLATAAALPACNELPVPDQPVVSPTCVPSASCGEPAPPPSAGGGEVSSQAPPSAAAPGAVLRHPHRFPTRVAVGPDGRVFVSDALAGAVFIYSSELTLTGEIPGLARPLGVAVDARQRLFVGEDGRDDIEVFDVTSSQPSHLFTMAEGGVEMPNDLACDRAGRLFVADSAAGLVRVFGPDAAWVADIAVPPPAEVASSFPSTLTIAWPDAAAGAGELYVGEQRSSRIFVYGTDDLAFRRAFGAPIESFSREWRGRFGKIQSLAMDAAGRLLVLDAYQHHIQAVDPQEGDFIEARGQFGTAPGALNLPLDLAVDARGRLLVTNAGNERFEALAPDWSPEVQP